MNKRENNYLKLAYHFLSLSTVGLMIFDFTQNEGHYFTVLSMIIAISTILYIIPNISENYYKKRGKESEKYK